MPDPPFRQSNRPHGRARRPSGYEPGPRRTGVAARRDTRDVDQLQAGRHDLSASARTGRSRAGAGRGCRPDRRWGRGAPVLTATACAVSAWNRHVFPLPGSPTIPALHGTQAPYKVRHTARPPRAVYKQRLSGTNPASGDLRSRDGEDERRAERDGNDGHGRAPGCCWRRCCRWRAGADANAVTGNTLLNHCEAGEGAGLESAIPLRDLSRVLQRGDGSHDRQ